eukprot:TRINITY_DN4836_c0_g1_i2.p1 TRINITY_DN4836_c0_g1~~TRINITY_DN4836_c0_g1_i2.p1  ORF type:complete len:547 (+),score=147.99 TRINITY_DN4836_c0_g1_i2:51-1643(+)
MATLTSQLCMAYAVHSASALPNAAADSCGPSRAYATSNRHGSSSGFSSFGSIRNPLSYSGVRQEAHECRTGGISIAALADGVERSVIQEREQIAERLNSVVSVVSDDAVPEEHKGLHSLLYGEAGGADVHLAEGKVYEKKAGEDDGTVKVPLSDYVTSRDAQKLAGVYAIYDDQQSLQYVGFSRNIVLSLKTHLAKLGASICGFVRVKVYDDISMITRFRLGAERDAWVSEQATVPPGNSSQKSLWEELEGVKKIAMMSEAEIIEYEEKKMKMRKAMGENIHDDEDDNVTEDSRERRLKLMQATEGDDWSSVIDGQTKATLRERGSNGTAAAVNSAETPAVVVLAGDIVSPFLRAETADEFNKSLGGEGGGEEVKDEMLVMTMETVDAALNEVRPYLIADGGNVEVVAVEKGIVLLRLQGACGTCPSSSATMKMGIERALRSKFGDQLQDVQQVGGGAGPPRATVEAVEKHLDILRPAIINFGGKVEVVEVDGLRGECRVRYAGPAPIGMGIQAAIKDKFPDIRKVVLLS